MNVVTRFAPSPTGFLHIGGAPTALFNWLFTRHFGGTFRLRIEDTDRARSSDAAIQAIIDGLRWLGLDWDDDIVFQFARANRHAEIAKQMVADGNAYVCYATLEELTAMRELARQERRSFQYDGRWRDRDPSDAPAGIAGAIRLRAPREGDTVIKDLVQGEVRVANAQLDDMVLLRADGTPTYMLSVVVDDHDMGITHVIRGDDHLNNAFRQAQVFKAMEWALPEFAHVPLIHGADGAKLSKRHGALGVDAYRDMGMLPEALRNYLLRLGWGHGDVEIIGTDEATRLFDVSDIGRSPARFDMAKLLNVNGHYLRDADDRRLVEEIAPRLETVAGRPLQPQELERLRAGMAGLKPRAKTLVELAENAAFYVRPRPLPYDETARRALDGAARDLLAGLRAELATADPWTEQVVEDVVRHYAETSAIKLGKVAQPLRAALTGSTVSPGVFEVMAALGRYECLGRLADVTEPAPA